MAAGSTRFPPRADGVPNLLCKTTRPTLVTGIEPIGTCSIMTDGFGATPAFLGRVIEFRESIGEPMGVMGTAQMKSLEYTDSFVTRHIGPREHEIKEMLDLLGFDSLDDLIDATIPRQIRTSRPLSFDKIDPNIGESGRSEYEILGDMRKMADKNKVFRSYIGMGYSDTITPPVILRNILENPGWYTQYTPYQAEIAQGRLEALLNFQTMVSDLTGMEISNSSLLDEGTAAAEAMSLCYAVKGRGRDLDEAFFVSELLPSSDDRSRQDPCAITRHRGHRRRSSDV